MADMNDLVAYIREGNEQAVKAAGLREADSLRWVGKSHAYLDVLAFIENEMTVPDRRYARVTSQEEPDGSL